jgi:hypothetical protein
MTHSQHHVHIEIPRVPVPILVALIIVLSLFVSVPSFPGIFGD